MDLQFITITDPRQAKDQDTKRKVRGHVMKGVQRSLKKRIKDDSVDLDISSLLTSDGLTSIPRLELPSMVGGGHADPFSQYPIRMNTRSHELFDHLRGKWCPMFETLSKIGFFATMQDPAGFSQILCSSAMHMSLLRGESPARCVEAISFSIPAIQSVNKRLQDPILGVSDGVINTILAFVCHAVMFNDLPSALMHLNGLEEILTRRGGLLVLQSNRVVRMVLFWSDVNTAFLQDDTPRFPSPDDILPPIVSSTAANLVEESLGICHTPDLMLAIRQVQNLNRLIETEIMRRNLWIDGVFAGTYIVPILHRLLSIRPEVSQDNIAPLQESFCRLGAVIYIAALRSKFGVDLVTDIYIRKLKESIALQDDSVWADHRGVLVWATMTAGIQSLSPEHRDWFVTTLAAHVVRTGCALWGDLMSVLPEALWAEGVFDTECTVFLDEVSRKSLLLYRYTFAQ